MRYRVGIKLPKKLGINLAMPAGEAKKEEVAFEIAIMEAVAKLRKERADAFDCTSYALLPYFGMEAGWQRDFQALVRNKPKEAVKELEKYRDINRNMFATYKVVR